MLNKAVPATLNLLTPSPVRVLINVPGPERLWSNGLSCDTVDSQRNVNSKEAILSFFLSFSTQQLTILSPTFLSRLVHCMAASVAWWSNVRHVVKCLGQSRNADPFYKGYAAPNEDSLHARCLFVTDWIKALNFNEYSFCLLISLEMCLSQARVLQLRDAERKGWQMLVAFGQGLSKTLVHYTLI